VGPVSNPAEGSASVRAFPAVADRWRKSRQCREDVVEAGLVLAVCDWGFCVYRQEHSVCLVPTASASNRLRQALGALTSGVSARTHHGQCAVSVGAGVQELPLSLSSRRARVPSRAATAAHSLIAPSQTSVTTPDRTRHLEGAGTQARSANDSPRRSLSSVAYIREHERCRRPVAFGHNPAMIRPGCRPRLLPPFGKYFSYRAN
jgi:hypothetical protein